MARKLYIHVGPRKTATSAIQRFLSEHDNSVIAYPKVGILGSNDYHGHHETVFKFFGERAHKHDDISIEEMLASIRKEARKNDRNVVISSEMLEHRDIGAFTDAIWAALKDPAIEVEYLVSCREHFSRAASWYNHRLRVRNSTENRDPDRFLVEAGRDICYEPLIMQLKQHRGSVTVLNYHPQEDWVKRFLIHIGFDGNQLPEFADDLVGDSVKIMIVNLAIKNVVSSSEKQRTFMKAFKALPSSKMPSKFIFGSDATAVAEQWYAKDREFLRRELSIFIPPPKVGHEHNNSFSLSESEFKEIRAVAEDLGGVGRKIVDFTRHYVADRAAAI